MPVARRLPSDRDPAWERREHVMIWMRTTPQTQTAGLPRARGVPAPCGVPTRRVRRTASRAWGTSCASRRIRGTGARRRRGLALPRRAQGRTNDRREQNNSHIKPRGVPARLRRREPPDRTIRHEIARAGPSGRSTGSEDCEVRLGRFRPGARAGFGRFEGGREGDRARARVAVCIDYETRRKDAPRAVPGSDFQRGRTTEQPAPDRADLVLEMLRIDSSKVWGKHRAGDKKFTMMALRDPGGQRETR